MGRGKAKKLGLTPDEGRVLRELEEAWESDLIHLLWCLQHDHSELEHEDVMWLLQGVLQRLEARGLIEVGRETGPPGRKREVEVLPGVVLVTDVLRVAEAGWEWTDCPHLALLTEVGQQAIQA